MCTHSSMSAGNVHVCATHAPYMVYGGKPLQHFYSVRECENFFLGGRRFFLSEINQVGEFA
jgi:hypothetical protein